MTLAKARPGFALATLACLSFAPPLHAQQTTPTPATVAPSVYSGATPGQPANGNSGHGSHRRTSRGGANGGGANGGGGNRGGGYRGGGNGGGDSGDRGDRDDHDDSQSRYGMSVTSLGPAGDTDPVEAVPLASWLQTNLYAAYVGGGAGKVVAHYPASSGTNVAAEVFAGARLKYAGIEASWDTLGYYGATIYNQQVQIATDLFSASLLGFLPLGGNTDFYLRYGRTSWNVTANSSSSGALPVKSGTNALMGAGIEFRHNALLIRIEAKHFLDVFQSASYNYTGLSVGGYFY